MNTACRQQMTTEKLFHKALINFSIIYLQIGNIFQLNYIERISCRYSIYGFYTIWLVYMVCFTESLSSIIACYWKSMYQELKEVNSWNVTDWSNMMKVHESFEIVHVSLTFFSLTGVTEIVNAQGSLWYLTSWNKYTDTKSCHL